MNNPLTLHSLGYSIVGIELDNNCNMACTFCPLPIREADKASFEIADVERLLDQICQDGTVDLVTFSQFNEPMMYPQLWDCIDMAKERSLRTLLITNGAMFSQRNIDKLLEHSPTLLKISAQCIKEENHNEMRGYKGKFDTYFDNLAKAVAALVDRPHEISEVQVDLAIQQKLLNFRRKISVALGVSDHGDPTIFDETPETLYQSLKDFMLTIESHSNSFTYDESHQKENLEKSMDVQQGTFDLAYNLTDVVNVAYKQFINGRRIKNYYSVPYGQCNNSNLGILANGDVTMCCFDYEGFTIIGNIKQKSLSEILEDGQSVIENIRRGGKFHCQACTTCMGSPTPWGSVIRTMQNYLRFGGDNSGRDIPPAKPFLTIQSID